MAKEVVRFEISGGVTIELERGQVLSDVLLSGPIQLVLAANGFTLRLAPEEPAPPVLVKDSV